MDSSVIIALFRKSEQLHREAVSIFMKNDGFLIPDYVLSEVLTVLKMREGQSSMRGCMNFLTNAENIEIYETPSEIFQQALTYFYDNNNKLSFVDTLLLTINQVESLPVYTFDKDLKKLLTKET